MKAFGSTTIFLVVLLLIEVALFLKYWTEGGMQNLGIFLSVPFLAGFLWVVYVALHRS